MSKQHPIISVTGSSGAGTSTVKTSVEQIFRREGVSYFSIEGDAFHSYNRAEMKEEVKKRNQAGDHTFSHFSYDANLLKKLQDTFKSFSETGEAKTRHYVHDEEEEKLYGVPPGHFTEWESFEGEGDFLFYEGLHGSVHMPDKNITLAEYADLKIGVVPVVNLEWIQKIHRDKGTRGYSTEAVTDVILRRMHDYVYCICPQFTHTDINFQRVPVVDTSNPFVARWIPTADESFVVIRFKDPKGIDFSYLTSMLHDSFMSRANSIVVPGGKMELAMQLIFTPLIIRMAEDKRRHA